MTKRKIRILFKIESNKITVYEYKNNIFRSIQDCGEDIIEYSDDFMNWFKNSIAYLKGKQELDYLIITDNSVELDFSDFDIVNQSSWNKERIRAFHNSILKGQGIILRNTQKREYYRANVKLHPLKYTVIFCDKNLKDVQKPKEKRGVELPKTKKAENKNNTAILMSDVKQTNELKIKNLDEEQKKIDLTKENSIDRKEYEITKEEDLNKEVNISDYYKKKIEQEEKERNNKRAKF
ncbi:hypothetical protein Q604_UNBC18735G0005 [human gut metagenome]|uniref:Uncharacterized protein n=1 Tax=human gut metagenome TaxID=408170 RepID=W1WHS1_9ZZZZ